MIASAAQADRAWVNRLRERGDEGDRDAWHRRLSVTESKMRARTRLRSVSGFAA
jgi:hypothetical protein